MTASFDNLFNGYEIQIDLPAIYVTPFQAEAIRKEVGDTPAQKLRYTCHVAEALNLAVNGAPVGSPFEDYGDFVINEEVYRLNPYGRSQFGMDAALKPYLTTSLVHVNSGVRYSFTWRGENVPRKLQELAVDHDEGRNTKRARISLSLDTAEKHIVGEKNGKPAREDPRTDHSRGPKSKRTLHGDTRRTHRRICRADLKSV